MALSALITVLDYVMLDDELDTGDDNARSC